MWILTLKCAILAYLFDLNLVDFLPLKVQTSFETISNVGGNQGFVIQKLEYLVIDGTFSMHVIDIDRILLPNPMSLVLCLIEDGWRPS